MPKVQEVVPGIVEVPVMVEVIGLVIPSPSHTAVTVVPQQQELALATTIVATALEAATMAQTTTMEALT
jgi:hypothetical protein